MINTYYNFFEMENLKDLSRIVKDINDASLRTIQDLRPILTSVADREGENYVYITQHLVEENPDLNEDHMHELIETTLLNLLNDAEAIILNMTSFVASLKNGDNMADIEDSFLKKVWLGDIFDYKGIEALEMLKLSLEENRKLCNRYDIVEMMKDDI